MFVFFKQGEFTAYYDIITITAYFNASSRFYKNMQIKHSLDDDWLQLIDLSVMQLSLVFVYYLFGTANSKYVVGVI